MLAYLGPPVSLESLVLKPENSLLHQSYRPRFQRHGTVNADGFGCGWFDTGVRPEPAVYRRDKPIWSDTSFASMAGLIRSGAVVAAVRDASTGSAVEESSTPPFTERGWLFCHNGMFEGFRKSEGLALWRLLSDARAARVRGTSDSEVLFGLILDRLDDGMSRGGALAWVISRCLEMTQGTFNFLLHNGLQITATAFGDSLFALEPRAGTPAGVMVASEPLDGNPAWIQVPDSSLVQGFEGRIVISPLEEVARA